MTLGLLDAEARRWDLGAWTIVRGLLVAVFAYTLRELLRRRAGGQAGWSQAVADPQVRRMLVLMHGDSAYPRTLDELAQRAGLARTGLAERLRHALGDTPPNHLRTLRMKKAMRLLSETQQTLSR